MDAVALAMEVLDEAKRKATKLQNKLNEERQLGKTKLVLLVVSIIMNVYLVVSCGLKETQC